MSEKLLFTNPYNDEDRIYELPSPTNNEDSSFLSTISKLSRHVSNQAFEKVGNFRQKLFTRTSTLQDANFISIPQLIQHCCQVINVAFDDSSHQITCAKMDSNTLLYLSISQLPFIFRLKVEPELNASAVKVEHETHGALIPASFLVDTDNSSMFIIAESNSKPGRVLIKYTMTQDNLINPISSLFYDYNRYVAMALNLDGNKDGKYYICHLSSDFSKKDFTFSINDNEPQKQLSDIPLELAKSDSKNHFWVLFRHDLSNELLHVVIEALDEKKVDSLSCCNFQPISVCSYDKNKLLLISQDRNTLYSIDQNKTIKTVFCSSQQERILTVCTLFEACTLPDSELIARYMGTLSCCYVITTERLIKLSL